MNNISNDLRLDLTHVWKIPATEKEISIYSVQRGDILFNNTNSPALVGKSCLFNIECEETFLFSNHLTRIRTRSSLNSRYLLYWIGILWQRRYFEDNCDKWVNQAAIRVEDSVFPFDIPLPPTINDQIAIANELERKMAEVEAMRQAALRQKDAVNALQSARLREFFPFKKVERLPAGWRWEKLRKLSTNIQYGISISSTSIQKGCKLLRITDIQNGKVDWGQVPYCECNGEKEAKYLLKDGDIVFVRTGATTGKSFLIRKPDHALFASYLIRVQCSSDLINPDYLYTFFQSPAYWDYISQGARGGTLAGFNATMLSKMMIPMPPTIDEQAKIANICEQRLSESRIIQHSAEKQLKAIKAMPGAILREVFDFGKN